MRALALASLLFLMATPAVAQQWTAEEQEVIDTMAMCWDAWTAAIPNETTDYFFRTCQPDEDALFWWTTEGAPQSYDFVRRNWDLISEDDDTWADIRPVAIRMFGDVAIVYLYGYWRANTADGVVITEYQRTEVYQRRDSDWIFIGAQGTPAAAEDADPYR